METANLNKINNDLEFLKRQILEIREHMVDADTILTDEEKRIVDESVENERQGKLVSFKEVKERYNL